VTSSSIQKIPFASRYYRSLLSLFPKAIEEFDLSAYDLVLSTSHSVAKGVLTHSNQLHICYMHTPMRYAWDLYFQYLKESKLDKGLLSGYAKGVLHRMRTWDTISANRVDHYLANSNYIARRIKKVYGKESTVIYPPVDTGKFSLSEDKEDFYLTASQFAPYKKIDQIVQAFRNMPDRKLVVIGDGGDRKKIRNCARGAKNIELLGYQPDEVLKEKLQKAKAFVFAAEEDFGILPVEAQACGTPVIAFGKGGAAETVVGGKTGLFFYEQTAAGIETAVKAFDRLEDKIDRRTVRKNAERFSKEVFKKEYSGFVDKKYSEFREKMKRGKA
jgi:glycosyltransferase involved in cell wall biosynthesis